MSSLCELQDHFRIDRQSIRDFEALIDLVKKPLVEYSHADDANEALADLQASFVSLELMRQSRVSPVNGVQTNRQRNSSYLEIYDVMDLVACDGHILEKEPDTEGPIHDESPLDEQLRVTLDIVNQVSD